jgi:hypothetical protein
MKEQDYIKAFQLTLDEIIESKFDMSIDWTARFKECIEKAVDIRFKEFIKNKIGKIVFDPKKDK